jgi:hypothetical protein
VLTEQAPGDLGPASEAARVVPRPTARLQVTIRGLLAAIVPVAAYLALFVEVTESARRTASHGWTYDPAACRMAAATELGLLVLSGLALSAYRRTCFLGLIVQLTTTPCALLTMIWAARASRAALIFVILIWLLVAGRTLASLPHRRREAGPARRPILVIIDSITAGAALLALLAPFACFGLAVAKVFGYWGWGPPVEVWGFPLPIWDLPYITVHYTL